MLQWIDRKLRAWTIAEDASWIVVHHPKSSPYGYTSAFRQYSDDKLQITATKDSESCQSVRIEIKNPRGGWDIVFQKGYALNPGSGDGLTVFRKGRWAKYLNEVWKVAD